MNWRDEEMFTPMPDLSQIPTGPDSEILRQQFQKIIGYYQDKLKYTEQRYREVYGTNRELRSAVETLQKRELKVLERWVRRGAIRRQRMEEWAFICAGGAILIPLFIVAVSFAWRLAVWAVAS